MVHKCAAFRCKSGYKGEEQSASDVKITFHSFPLANKELCDRWIKANSRKDYNSTKHSRLCSLHFTASDFVEQRTDSNTARRRRLSTSFGDKLTLRYLKDNLCSAISSYIKISLNYSSGPRETVSSTVSGQQEREAHLFDILEQSFNAADDISGLSLADILSRLQSERVLPDGFTWILCVLVIYWLGLNNNIKDDLSVTASLAGKSVPA